MHSCSLWASSISSAESPRRVLLVPCEFSFPKAHEFDTWTWPEPESVGALFGRFLALLCVFVFFFRTLSHKKSFALFSITALRGINQAHTQVWVFLIMFRAHAHPTHKS